MKKRTLRKFVPEKSEGSVELGFEISTDELCGKTIVVYEEIKADGKSIAEHKDPEAKEQSIYFRKLVQKRWTRTQRHKKERQRKSKKL